MKIGNLIQNVLEGIKNLRPRLGLYNVCSIISFIVLYIQRILNNLELGRQIPGIHNSLLSKSQWRKNAGTMCVEDELGHLALSFSLSIIQWHAWRTNARTHVQLGYDVRRIRRNVEILWNDSLGFSFAGILQDRRGIWTASDTEEIRFTDQKMSREL